MVPPSPDLGRHARRRMLRGVALAHLPHIEEFTFRWSSLNELILPRTVDIIDLYVRGLLDSSDDYLQS